MAQDMSARSRTVLCAVMGDVTGHLIMAPAEVIKTQMQMRLHQDLRTAATAVLKKGPASWFRGYGSMLMRDVPYRALQIVLFDEMAHAYMTHQKNVASDAQRDARYRRRGRLHCCCHNHAL